MYLVTKQGILYYPSHCQTSFVQFCRMSCRLTGSASGASVVVRPQTSFTLETVHVNPVKISNIKKNK